LSAAPVLVLLIPIFDTTLVTLSRWFSGRRASQGGRDHSSHRLVAIGLSERAAVALLVAARRDRRRARHRHRLPKPVVDRRRRGIYVCPGDGDVCRLLAASGSTKRATNGLKAPP